MILSCPECLTRFRIALDRLSLQGSKLRCSRCGHVFSAGPGEGEAESLQERQLQQSLQAESAIMEKPSFNPEQKPGSHRKGTGYLWIVLVFLGIIFLAGAGYYFYPQLRLFLPGQEKPREQGMEFKQKDLAPQAQDIEDMLLQDVRQYMVQNENIGRLLVVEGRVQNNASQAKKMVRLKAALYDDQDRVLEEREFLCGNTVSLFQLQVMEIDELKSALQSKVGILTNNSNVAPGQSVEFMHIFANPPSSLEEFSLQVIQAQNVQAPSSSG